MLTTKDLPNLIRASLSALKRHQEEINKLNVYPVPDGDTGTNMVLTMEAVCNELSKTKPDTMEKICKTITYGSLMGGRGNSGVILSQIIKGFCEILSSKEFVNSVFLAEALKNSVQVAYRAIRKPVEGTMLTVIKDTAAASKKFDKEVELDVFLEYILNEAKKSVMRTPELLPVLKEAGVVDAGGWGLAIMGSGILSAIKGEAEHEELTEFNVPVLQPTEEIFLEYQYCTEFILKSSGIELSKFEEQLAPLGDSLLVVGSETLTHVHIHTNEPGTVLSLATNKGSVSEIKINNMQEEAAIRTEKIMADTGKVGLVAVASGEGIKKILSSLGVQRIVNGGQTMNPSTADILKAVEDVNASKVIILPNNKNIIMAAQRVSELTKKEIGVVPTKSIPQALSALLAFEEEKPFALNVKNMMSSLSNVKTGEITKAIRNSKNSIGKIKKGDFIGLIDHEVNVSGKSFVKIATKLINNMLDDESEVVTLLFGEGVKEKDLEELSKIISKEYPDIEIEIHEGGQALYPLIIGVE
ncbi:DAK2 domain-containing protein [Candidatus Oleimmundimicrobium sp.]|uniref:DAK2 domain-containing protein n=1 Tax=Candidatus Oleimmundimicrobium sp. TaxID=3060597 RepID=UPI00271E4452|nr:DAK2 domain-containing protein [Candidatus Oleimmundimicrobium sp.]MDO8885340.1 DAK2 domain-containing protein [Candidatus Oleimmundimicrobium sp.]